MSQKTETEVLVVGAGPVGLFTALCLTSRGVNVEIVDEEFRTAAHSYALAIHPQSIQLLDQIGLGGTLLAQGYPVETVAFYNGPDRCGELKLAELKCRFPYVIVMPQSGLEDLMEKQLKERGVKVRWNHRATRIVPRANCATVEIDKMARASCGYAVATTEWTTEKSLSVQAAFIVGADGHRSVVRRTLDVEYPRIGTTETFAVFEFHTDKDLEAEVRIVFDGQTTNVLWPLPGGRCRWSFQRERGGPADESRAKQRLTVPIGRQAFPHVSGDELSELIRTRAPWFGGRIRQIDWSMEVRFDRRLASRYGEDRLWLAGDSAHLTGPVGGQSLNMGLRESADLAWRLAGILRQGTPLSSLADYSERFHAQWLRLLAVGNGFTPTDRAAPWARELCAKILPCIPATGDDLIKLASEIGLEFAPKRA